VSQGTLYYPLAGYYAGDRQGPFVEATVRPLKGLQLYGSASRYRNNWSAMYEPAAAPEHQHVDGRFHATTG